MKIAQIIICKVLLGLFQFSQNKLPDKNLSMTLLKVGKELYIFFYPQFTLPIRQECWISLTLFFFSFFLFFLQNMEYLKQIKNI